MSIPHFDSEEAFREWYLQLPSAEEQVVALHAWRVWQIGMVGALRNIVSLLASEQYTQIDHFLLELLQNADDNLYREGNSPELKITLTGDACTFECNEQGFTAENVFAISYAATSTKHRTASPRTFIGEKGLGFKSIFGVADAVQIHSNDFHFELRDKEFILPHWLGGSWQAGSRIVIRFKQSLAGIAATLSNRLRALSEKADHFVLFLQKLESLVIDDQVGGYQRTVRILRDDASHRYLVENEGRTKWYHVEAFQITFPEELVRNRFENLSGAVQRDIVVAVPLPADLPEAPAQGQLFCYLPTKVKTGFPFHIQLDAKTTTNRENIENVERSTWNRGLLDVLPKILVRLFLKLRDHTDFRSHLPRYLPNPSQLTLGNEDLTEAVENAIELLKSAEIVLARNGKFTAPAAVKLAPDGISSWVETEQYEPHLAATERSVLRGEEQVTATITGAFIHSDWRPYANVLGPFGCELLDTAAVAALFQMGGTPTKVSGASEDGERKFLNAVMRLSLPQFYSEATVEALRAAPIFPVLTGNRASWSSINSNTMVVSSETRNFPVPPDAAVINSRFTFTPGGTGSATVRSFNERFRTYLTDVLGLRRYSDVEYLDAVLLPSMQVAPEVTGLNDQQHLQLTKRWLNVYNRVWRRKNTIVDDSSEQRWEQLLSKLGKCFVPVRSPRGTEITTIELQFAFLPQQLGGLSGIEEAYSAFDAPFVSLALHAAMDLGASKRRRKAKDINWTDWAQFLREGGAEPGPYLLEVTRGDLEGQYAGVYAAVPFYDDIISATPERHENGFRILKLGTTAFDSFTSRLLSSAGSPEVITRGIAAHWPEVSTSDSKTEFLCSRWRYSRSRSHADSLAKRQVGSHLMVRSDQGIRLPALCFVKTPENQVIAGGILPLVDPVDYSNNSEFLLSIGVHSNITFENLEDRVREAVSDPETANASDVAPYLRIAARLAERGPRERNWIRTARIFFHTDEKQLLDYAEWSKRGGGASYPEDVASALAMTFSSISNASFPDLLKDLVSLGDLMSAQAELIKWTLRVADHLTRENQDAVGVAFANFLRDYGLTVAGRQIKCPTELPLAWDAVPAPSATTSILLLPQAPIDRSRCDAALRALGWPLLSESTVQATCEESIALEGVAIRQVRLALVELFSTFRRTSAGQAKLMEQSRLGINLADLDKVIVTCKGLSLDINRQGTSIGEYDVPYWWQSSSVFIDVSRISAPLGIASILDAECGTTTTPFFEHIFVAQEMAAKAGDPSPATAASRSSPDVPAPRPADGTTPSSENGGAPDGKLTPTKRAGDGPRKRLYSYVLPKADRNAPSKADGTASQASVTETEKAAVEHFTTFLRGLGIKYKSVEKDNVGYDFEVVVAGRTLCVEVKGSRDHWVNWEHALTPNEFRAAQEKGETYVICIVERAFDPDAALTFLQDPWELVDGFLFDAPWKQVATDASKLFSAPEDSFGVPPPRDED